MIRNGISILRQSLVWYHADLAKAYTDMGLWQLASGHADWAMGSLQQAMNVWTRTPSYCIKTVTNGKPFVATPSKESKSTEPCATSPQKGNLPTDPLSLEAGDVLGNIEASSTVAVMADAYEHQFKYDMAETIATHAQQMLQQAQVPASDPANIAPLRVLGAAYYHEGKYEQAIPPLEQALALWRNSPHDDDSEGIQMLGNLGEAYLKMGQNAQAATDFTRLLSDYAKSRSLGYGDRANAEFKLGKALQAQKQFAPAITAFQNALNVLNGMSDGDAVMKIDCLNNLVTIYRAQGKSKEAKAAQKQLEQAQAAM
jgi:tetratricopeptide (TPR) repeat protein